MAPGGTDSIRVHLVLSAAILALAAVVGSGLDRYGKSRRTSVVPAAANVTAAEVVAVKTETEAYHFWKSRGYRGRIILYVADRWNRIDPNEYNISPLHRPYPLPVYNLPKEREREFLDHRNFLFMAAANGFTRRIDAVLSPAGFSEMRVQAASSRNASIADGRMSVSHNGFPRTISMVETYRSSAEPVLVFVGASIFESISPENLVAALTRSRVTTDLVILCNQDGNPHVSASAREQLAVFAKLLRSGSSRWPNLGRGK